MIDDNPSSDDKQLLRAERPQSFAISPDRHPRNGVVPHTPILLHGFSHCTDFKQQLTARQACKDPALSAHSIVLAGDSFNKILASDKQLKQRLRNGHSVPIVANHAVFCCGL